MKMLLQDCFYGKHILNILVMALLGIRISYIELGGGGDGKKGDNITTNVYRCKGKKRPPLL